MADWFVHQANTRVERLPNDANPITWELFSGAPGTVAQLTGADGRSGVAATSTSAVSAVKVLRKILANDMDGALALTTGFAACIWQGDRLELLRSPFGEVPLEVQKDERGLSVTTNPAQLGHAGYAVDALVAYLYGVHRGGPGGMLEGRERLEPGEQRVYRENGLQSSRFLWEPAAAVVPSGQGPSYIREALLQRLRETGGVDAATLSGGLDSAAVVAAWCQSHPQSTLPCISLVAPGMPELDESDRIDTLAGQLPIEVHKLIGHSLWSLHRGVSSRLPPSWGPTASSTTDALMSLYARAADFGTGILTGQGGDLLMAWSDALQIRSALRNPAEIPALMELVRAMPFPAFVKQLGIELTRKQPSLFNLLRKLKRTAEEPSWILAERPPSPALEDSLGTMKWRQLRSWDWELGMRCIRFATAKAGVETIDPLFDVRLFNIVAGLKPGDFRGPLGRKVWRDALADWLPEKHVTAAKSGLLDPLVEKGLGIVHHQEIRALFQPGLLANAGLIDPNAFLLAFERYGRQVREAFPTQSIWASWPIWRTISAELWLRALQQARDK